MLPLSWVSKCLKLNFEWKVVLNNYKFMFQYHKTHQPYTYAHFFLTRTIWWRFRCLVFGIHCLLVRGTIAKYRLQYFTCDKLSNFGSFVEYFYLSRLGSCFQLFPADNSPLTFAKGNISSGSWLTVIKSKFLTYHWGKSIHCKTNTKKYNTSHHKLMKKFQFLSCRVFDFQTLVLS